MIYNILLSPRAVKDISFLKKTDPNAFKKLEKLLIKLVEHPLIGTGKPKKLKYTDGEIFSRRITSKHRLIYSIDQEITTVYVINTIGNYDDK